MRASSARRASTNVPEPAELEPEPEPEPEQEQEQEPEPEPEQGARWTRPRLATLALPHPLRRRGSAHQQCPSAAASRRRCPSCPRATLPRRRPAASPSPPSPPPRAPAMRRPPSPWPWRSQRSSASQSVFRRRAARAWSEPAILRLRLPARRARRARPGPSSSASVSLTPLTDFSAGNAGDVGDAAMHCSDGLSHGRNRWCTTSRAATTAGTQSRARPCSVEQHGETVAQPLPNLAS